MKASVILALAAGLGEVNATFGNWQGAHKYTPVGSIDNKCDDKLKGGWKWDDLSEGQFDKYQDWDFKGWTCGEDLAKRDLATRTFGKTIRGECGSNKEEAPSFGCSTGKCGSGKQYEKFSVKEFHVKPEFDCRLEFHYDMPDGSTCKQSAECSKSGTTIRNKQCGGAKKVRFVYPKQNKPKDKCNIEVPRIDFDCDKPDVPEKPETTIPVGGETTSAEFPGETTTFPYGEETSTVPAGEESTTVPAEGEETSTVPAEGEETSTVPAEGEETSTVPAEGEETTSAELPGQTTSVPAEDEETSTVPAGEETTTFTAGEESTTVPVEETTIITTFDSTSTIYTTEITTITSCAPDVPDCPVTQGTPVVVTETIPLTTTICPVTETRIETNPVETLPATKSEEDNETKGVPTGDKITSAELPGQTTSVPAEGEETKTVPAGEESTTVPAEGEETSTVPAEGEETSTVPAEGEESTTVPAEGEETTSAELPGQTTSVPAEGEETEPATSAIITTTYDTTSTVYTTNVLTITSCGPEVPDCPVTAGTPVVVTETVAISTTVCPVTETLTGTKPAGTKPAETAPATGSDKTTDGSKPEKTTDVPEEETTVVTTFDSTSTIYTTNVKTITSCGPEVPDCPATAGTAVVVTETVAIGTTICPITETQTHKGEKPIETGSKPEKPEEETPGYNVPDVVPSCLNTFLEYVEDCKDNTDAACYCPKKDFVDDVFECLYAHAESDDVVAEAVSFFQGICAPYAGENPGIATGADKVTSYITVTGTTVLTSAHYTTVVVETTITEPCVTEGTTIEGSSTVRTVSTEITVPEVGFTTGPSGGHPIAPPTATATVPAAGTDVPQVPETPEVPAETLITSKPAVGTGNLPVPTASVPADNVPVTAGAARTGMGFAAVILAVAIAL